MFASRFWVPSLLTAGDNCVILYTAALQVVLENTKELRDDLTTFLRQSRGPTWTRINQWLDRATLNLPEKVKTLKSGKSDGTETYHGQ